MFVCFSHFLPLKRIGGLESTYYIQFVYFDNASFSRLQYSDDYRNYDNTVTDIIARFLVHDDLSQMSVSFFLQRALITMFVEKLLTLFIFGPGVYPIGFIVIAVSPSLNILDTAH